MRARRGIAARYIKAINCVKKSLGICEVRFLLHDFLRLTVIIPPLQMYGPQGQVLCFDISNFLLPPCGQRESAVLLFRFGRIIRDDPPSPAEGLTRKTFVPTVPVIPDVQTLKRLNHYGSPPFAVLAVDQTGSCCSHDACSVMFQMLFRFTCELNSSLRPLKENHMADLFRLSASEAAARIAKANSRPKHWCAPVSSGSMHGNRCNPMHGSIWTAILPWRRRGNAARAQPRSAARNSICGQGHHGHGRLRPPSTDLPSTRQPSYGGRGVRGAEPRSRRRAFGQDGDHRACQPNLHWETRPASCRTSRAYALAVAPAASAAAVGDSW